MTARLTHTDECLIVCLLHEGYGAEDIAVKLAEGGDSSAKDYLGPVRAYIRKLRLRGDLSAIYGGRK